MRSSWGSGGNALAHGAQDPRALPVAIKHEAKVLVGDTDLWGQSAVAQPAGGESGFKLGVALAGF